MLLITNKCSDFALLMDDKSIKISLYAGVRERIGLLIDDQTDWIGAMSTAACELHHTFDYFHWTGFYRVVDAERLQIGPYQGGHGCLHITFGRGVCGKAARTGRTLLVPDVSQFEDHIACSSTTTSELVVPIKSNDHRVVAVLDVDSDVPDAFDEVDVSGLEALCQYLSERFFSPD